LTTQQTAPNQQLPRGNKRQNDKRKKRERRCDDAETQGEKKGRREKEILGKISEEMSTISLHHFKKDRLPATGQKKERIAKISEKDRTWLWLCD